MKKTQPSSSTLYKPTTSQTPTNQGGSSLYQNIFKNLMNVQHHLPSTTTLSGKVNQQHSRQLSKVTSSSHNGIKAHQSQNSLHQNSRGTFSPVRVSEASAAGFQKENKDLNIKQVAMGLLTVESKKQEKLSRHSKNQLSLTKFSTTSSLKPMPSHHNQRQPKPSAISQKPQKKRQHTVTHFNNPNPL